MTSDVFITLPADERAELHAEQWMAATEYAHERGRLYAWLKWHGFDDEARKVRHAFLAYLAVGEWSYSIEFSFIAGEKAGHGDLARRLRQDQFVSKMQEHSNWVPRPRPAPLEETRLRETELRLLRASVEGVPLQESLREP